MIQLSLLNQIFVVLIDLIGIWLAILVYRNNPKGKLNKIFLWMVVYMFGWVNFAYLARLIGENNPSLATIFLRIAWFVTPLLFLFLYFLVIYLLEQEKKYSLLNKLCILLGGLLAFTTSFTNLIIKGVESIDGDLTIIYGKGMWPFLGIISFLIVATLYPLIKTYVRSKTEKKFKIEYFLAGIFIFYLANIAFNITFPIFFKIVRFYWIGDYSSIILLGFTAYAIVKRELFGIKVVLTELLVGVIAILLLVQALGSETLFEYIWKGSLFVVFLVFGYMLIRSVLREIKLREALQQAYAKLQVLDKAKSEFISIASHQLRTPLTAIKGYISMIIEGSYGKMPEKAQRPVENVYKSAERLINLVNDLLSVSRLEAGKIKVELEKTCIEDLILGIIEELKIKADKKKIYLKFQKPLRALPKIIIDPDKIRQVILNIIDNAIRYTITGGITIEVEVKTGKLRIIISDTGEGMTREEISNMFESFSRGAAGGRLWTEGSGLGLYIARRFVEMHHGKVWVESQGKGKGSTFYIELPRKPGSNENFNKFMKAV